MRKYLCDIPTPSFAGKFTTSVPGVYSVTLYTFSRDNDSKQNVMKNPADESGEVNVCSAHVHQNDKAGVSCGVLVELNVGDELYVKGGGGQQYAPLNGEIHVTFNAYLLYPANTP